MRFSEAVELTEGPVDGVLKDVRVLNYKSRNNRLYDVAAVRAAQPMYEGAGVFLNHGAGGPRDVRDKVGRLSNVRVTEAGVLADLMLLTTHPSVPAIMEDFTKKAGVFSLSHEIDADSTKQGDMQIVTKITGVEGVAVVARGATTTTLREEEQKKPTITEETIGGLVAALVKEELAKLKYTAPQATPPVKPVITEEQTPAQRWAAL